MEPPRKKSLKLGLYRPKGMMRPFLLGRLAMIIYFFYRSNFLSLQNSSSPSLNLSKSRHLPISARKIGVYIYNMANEAKEHRKSMNALLIVPP